MPANNSVKKALSLIKQDSSKVLGLQVGSHTNIEPGQYIGRAGQPLKRVTRDDRQIRACETDHFCMVM